VGAGVAADRRGAPPRGQLETTVEMARRAESLGADAVMVYPCPGLAEDPEPDRRIVELHTSVADAVAVPLIAFHLHAEGGGHPYTIGTVRELLAVPRLAGVKIATLDDAIACQDVIAEVRAAGRLAITGEDRMFGPSLMWGAQAALVGIAAAAAPLSVRLLDTWFARKAADFLDASARIDALAAATFHAPIEGYVQRLLWVAAWEGLIPPEHANDPFGPPPVAAEHDRLRRVLERVIGDEGRREPA
jgi:4-hydroxy-tetrahydrodipicolinate synthase